MFDKLKFTFGKTFQKLSFTLIILPTIYDICKCMFLFNYEMQL